MKKIESSEIEHPDGRIIVFQTFENPEAYLVIRTLFTDEGILAKKTRMKFPRPEFSYGDVIEKIQAWIEKYSEQGWIE